MRASSVVSKPDPFSFVEDYVSAPGRRDTNDRTLYSGSLSDAAVILIAGQSNVCNSHPTPFVPTNTGFVLNHNIYDGAAYRATDPLLGCAYGDPAGNFAGRLGDKLINAGYCTKVLLVPVGIDGTAISQWQSQLDFGSRLITGIRRLGARGLAPHAILWGQGESDGSLGTTQANYTAMLNVLIGLSRTEGYNGPWFIAKQTMSGGITHSAVQLAQTGIVDHSVGIWAGPDADSISTAFRSSGDGTHFTDTGADMYAGLWLTALHAFGAPF